MKRFDCIFFIFLLLLLNSCNRAFHRVVKNTPVPGINYIGNYGNQNISFTRKSDGNSLETFTFTSESGKEIIYYPALRDSSGELVGVRQLDEVVISTKAHNIAERNGIITLGFIITIPSRLLHNYWQTEMEPVLARDRDTVHFQKIIVSGAEFKKSQVKGYRKFEKYIESIIPDDASLLETYSNLGELTIFLERHLPQSLVLSGIRNDTLTTELGLSEKVIIEKYLKRWLIKRNKKRKSQIDKVFTKYVKNPYINGARLDSVIKNGEGNFDYHYSQDIVTNENSRKLFLWVKGKIRNTAGLSINLAESDTITYNVSSVSAFTQDITRYKKKIIEKRVKRKFDSRITFKTGKYNIDPGLMENQPELNKIHTELEKIIADEEFDLDSVIITSSSSPEGNYHINKTLSQNRSGSIKNHIFKKAEALSSLYSTMKISDGHIDGNDKSVGIITGNRIIMRNIPENWDLLHSLIADDNRLNNKDKILDCFNEIDLDKRESMIMKHRKEYKYIKENLYPHLRSVTIELDLLRKGMIKDTVHTTEPDNIYSKGVSFLKKRKYKEALEILIEYNDINTAIAHLSLGQDYSAFKILSGLEESAHQLYMMAIIHSRKGDDEQAAKFFLKSKELDVKMAYRGGLDPEISRLIDKYDLNRDLFE